MPPSTENLTELLQDWSAGKQSALEKLMPMVYGELRRVAGRYLRRERQGHTLQATALVNEAYLRLINQKNVHWQNRAHFFGLAAQLMRRILIDYARTQQRAKRGGVGQKLSLDEAMGIPAPDMDLILLDDALNRLALLDHQQSRIVELRYFGGLSIEEAAEVLQVSPATVKRDWAMARAWLHQQLAQEAAV
jgi:RNA polymerase sigma factor, TIGR02999 family